MRVAVLGMGYVGSVTAAVLAREGHHVTGVDSNRAKIDTLERGESPVLEPGLPELVRRATLAGRLLATTDAASAVHDAEVVVICVGTPSASNGGLDTRALEHVSAEIGHAIAHHAGYPVVALRSTVLPDVVEGLVAPALAHASGRAIGDGFGLVVNPEFLREGTAILDFDDPQFTLVGSDEARSAAVMQRLYGFLKAPFVETDRRTASLVKYACNAFHAAKVAFANEIGAIAASAGVSGQEVMRIVCLDNKLNLSAAYLRPGMPFGGSCLPKDIRAALHYGRRNDVPLPLLGGVLESNRLQIESCVARILQHGRGRIGFFGMAFKAGTDDLRESPTVSIAEALIGKGLQVRIYDRRVSLAHLVGANRDYVDAHLPHIANLLRSSLEDVVAESDVLVIGNGDPEFARLPALMQPKQVLVDLVGALTPATGVEERSRRIG